MEGSVQSEMMRLCLEHRLPEDIAVVIEQPYIPWVPKKWNGLLVLAEAQNLSKTNANYVDWIGSRKPEEQVCRLGERKDTADLNIQPWDDCSLKLAVEAAFGEDANQTAVSNAVLWSQVTESNANMTPSPHLITTSAELWSRLLPVLQPQSVITAGNVAHRVIDRATDKINHTFNHYRLRLPAKTAMSRVSGMFDLADLLLRYPEVATAEERYRDRTEQFRLNKIFYACHAVSLYGSGISRAHHLTDNP